MELDHAALRDAIANSLEEWAGKFAGMGKWWGNTTRCHDGAGMAIVSAHTHGLLDHELVVSERITASLTRHARQRQVEAAIFTFFDLKQLITNPGVSPRPAPAEKDYSGDAEVCRRIAAMVRAGGGAGSNDGRDAWMYRKKLNGEGHTKIRLDLEKIASEQSWDTIDTDQGIGRAIDRYCEKRGLEKLRRKSPSK